MQRRWKCFLKTVKVDTLEFPFVIAKIRIFLETLFDALVNDNNQYCVNWYAKIEVGLIETQKYGGL